jgi:hypothetical protein
VVVEAAPSAAFEMAEPDLLLEFLIVPFDAPAQFSFISELPAGPAVVPAINGSVGAVGRRQRRLLVGRFWSTAIGFWGRRGKRTAWVLSAAVLAIILFNLAMLYAIDL